MTRSTRSLVALALLAAPALLAQEAAPVTRSPRPPRFTAGIGAATLAAYPGSNDRRTLVLPILGVDLGRAYLGAGTAGASGGAGLYLVRGRHLTWSVDLGGTMNRPAATSDDLTGFTDRGFGVTAGSGLTLRLAGIELGLTGATGLRREVGTFATASLGAQRLVARRLLLGGAVSATVADRRNMAWDFGVSAEDAAASGRAAFAPRGGLRDVSVSVTPALLLTPTLSFAAFGTVSRLGDRAMESPLVRQRTTASVGAALVRRF